MSQPRAGETSRREALRMLALTGLSALSWPTILSGCRAGTDPCNQARTFYADPKAAASIGREYLQANPDEGNLAVLCHALELDVEPPAAAWRNQVRLRHRSDFEQQRLTEIRGWVLSRTEAQLCALASLAT